eukprot:3936017-Rhodomonas_salina.1
MSVPVCLRWHQVAQSSRDASHRLIPVPARKGTALPARAVLFGVPKYALSSEHALRNVRI